MNDIKIIKIIGDGNCFYRCLSFFLLGNDDFFQDIKNEIINWIDNNRETFNDFLEMMTLIIKVKKSFLMKNIIT